jgi:hypothetical protein
MYDVLAARAAGHAVDVRVNTLYLLGVVPIEGDAAKLLEESGGGGRPADEAMPGN